MTDFANMAFQNQQNQITREREDTAVQRRAKDMEAAGFNPVLAAGNPAGAQALSLPKIGNPVEAASALMRSQQDISKSAAETVRVDELTKQTKAQTRIANAQADQEEIKAGAMKDTQSLFQVAGESLEDKPGHVYDPYVAAERARLRQQLSEAKGKEKGAELTEAQAGLAGLDLETLKKVGGSAAGNAALQTILTLLRMLK